jgi:hypothetical protein
MNNNFLPYQLKKNAEQANNLASQLAQKAQQADLVDSTAYTIGKNAGLVNDGTTDNSVSFQNLLNLAVTTKILIPKGTYNFTNTVSSGINNKVIEGIPGLTILQTNSLTEILNLLDSQNVTFKNITFVSNYATASIYGVISGQDVNLSNIYFENCTFNTNACNGVKLIEQSTKKVNNLQFINCNFSNCGRMGIEFQDHAWDGTTRFSNITMRDCTFNSCGLNAAAGAGMGLSFSGNCQGFNLIRNTFTDCRDIGAEIIGVTGATLDGNIYIGNTQKFIPISLSGGNNTTDITIVNEKSYGILSYIRLNNAVRLSMMHNMYNGIDSIQINTMSGSRILSNTVVVNNASNYCLYVAGTSSANEFDGNVLDNSAATNVYSMIRFYGSAVTKNRVDNNRMTKGTGGVFIDEQSGATGNEIYTNYQNGQIVNGKSFAIIDSKVYKAVTSVSGASTATINLGGNTSWDVFELEVSVMGVSSSDNQFFHCKKIVYGSVIAGATPNIANLNVATIGTDSNVTFTTSTSGNNLTLTCTNTDTSVQTPHRWAIRALSPTGVTIS